MKTLVVHDYMDNIGGGEKLMLSLARGIKADLASLDINRDLVGRMGYDDVKLIDCGKTIKSPPVKQIIASIKHQMRDHVGYDRYIFSGNWSHYGAKKNRPNTWYCHTPVRAFYIDREKIALSMNPLARTFFNLWVKVHSRFDRSSVKDIENIIANSQNTRARIEEIYGRSAQVVYPGVDLERFRFIESGDFWLSVNRLYPEKRIELQIKAFEMLPKERLVIVGGVLGGDHSAGYAKRLIESAPKNVSFQTHITEGELAGLYGRCRGFITTAQDEDFGMTPVEAMSAGKPTVAVDEGGYRETIKDGITGYLVKPTVDYLVDAIRTVGLDPLRYQGDCVKNSKNFSLENFISKMGKSI